MDLLYDAFGFVLGLLYKLVNNYFVAIGLFALLVKIVLLPSAIKQQKGTATQTRLQPKLRRIQERYKGDKNAQQKIQEEQQALYQREGFNPMNMGCLPLLIQFPIIIGLYGAVYKPLTYIINLPKDTINACKEALTAIGVKVNDYQFEIQIVEHIGKIKEHLLAHPDKRIANPEAIATQIQVFGDDQLTFFGINLTSQPSFKALSLLLLIPILSFLTSMATSLITQMRQKRNNPAGSNMAMTGCMTFGMPLFSAWMTTMFPAAVGIYWIINNIYSFIQTLLVGHFYSPDKVIARTMVEETIQRRSKENNMKIIAERKKNEENNT